MCLALGVGGAAGAGTSPGEGGETVRPISLLRRFSNDYPPSFPRSRSQLLGPILSSPLGLRLSFESIRVFTKSELTCPCTTIPRGFG